MRLLLAGSTVILLCGVLARCGGAAGVAEPEFDEAAAARTLRSAPVTPEGISIVQIPASRVVSGAFSRLALAANEVEISQYGELESVAAYRSGSFLGIRFDPPFSPPFMIAKIRFPSFTMNGVPASFPSVCLIGTNSSGRIEGPPIVRITPFEGSPDGMNEVPVNFSVTEPNKTYYWCVEFPPASAPTFPNDYPFLRMDYLDMDRGFFANSFALVPTTNATPILLTDRNLIASMVCTLPAADAVPIEPSRNLGANRVKSETNSLGELIFSFTPSGDTRSDGTPTQRSFLRRTDLMYRQNPHSPWTVFASAGPHTASLSTEPFPAGLTIWATQAVDRNGHRAVTSNAVTTVNFIPGRPSGTSDDSFEPNGRPQDAFPLRALGVSHFATTYPAGDKDYYSIEARPGDQIDISIGRSAVDGANDLLPVVQLADVRGRVLAVEVGGPGSPSPQITYVVPTPSPNASPAGPRQFTILITDIRGSFLSPDTAPRVIAPFPAYVLTVSISRASHAAQEKRPPGPRLQFRLAGPNPTRTGTSFLVGAASTPGQLDLRIFDVRGRLVRRIQRTASSSGATLVHWDGRSGRGELVPAGRYVASVMIGTTKHFQRVVILR
jgi:hypothetical protein